jgi:hypothetical protein
MRRRGAPLDVTNLLEQVQRVADDVLRRMKSPSFTSVVWKRLEGDRRARYE